ncbi:MAG: cupin domain-containing protein [Deltaproteobacteria bacterium]|nr:cupin domain-containing protein [Deltaproteobacteria bacterium]
MVGLAHPSAAIARGTVGAALRRLVRQEYSALHACYRQILAQDRSRGGTVFVELEAGQDGRVVKARVVRNELEHAGLADCLTTLTRGWRIPDLQAQAKVVLPLTFRPDKGQFVVHSADVRRVGMHSALLNAKNVGITQSSMSLLSVKGSAVVKPHLGALWFVLEGRGRLVSKAGWAARLRAGEVVMPRVGGVRVEAKRRSLLKILTISPTAHSSKKARRPLRLGRIKTFQYSAVDKSLFAGVVRLKAGQQLSARTHLSEDTLIYVLKGKGQAVVEGRRRAVGPGTGVGVSARREYGLQATTAMRVVVVYAPRGPERRLRREGLLSPTQ